MNIDINKLSEINKELSSLQDDDALFIDENGISKYAIIPIETYEKVEDLLSAIDDNPMKAEIRVIGGNGQLTYEEYERVKSMLLDAIEKNFKPKAEKLN